MLLAVLTILLGVLVAARCVEVFTAASLHSALGGV